MPVGLCVSVGLAEVPASAAGPAGKCPPRASSERHAGSGTGDKSESTLIHRCSYSLLLIPAPFELSGIKRAALAVSVIAADGEIAVAIAGDDHCRTILW